MAFALKRKKDPTTPFQHNYGCKILETDPDVEIKWAEIRSGYWEAVCVCGKQWWQDPSADDRERQSPWDPKTFRHSPVCEHRETTDPHLIKAILKVQDGLEPGYWWITCNVCQHQWQTTHFRPTAAPK